jgi:hypothetical protein
MTRLTAYQRDGIRLRIQIPDNAPDLSGALASAYARPLSGGVVVSAPMAQIESEEIVVDFGPGSVLPGQQEVQVVVTLSGRDYTVFAGVVMVSASLAEA